MRHNMPQNVARNMALTQYFFELSSKINLEVIAEIKVNIFNILVDLKGLL